jgi:hypothetical protein
MRLEFLVPNGVAGERRVYLALLKWCRGEPGGTVEADELQQADRRKHGWQRACLRSGGASDSSTVSQYSLRLTRSRNMGMAAEDEVRTTEVCRQVQPCGLATLGKAKIRFGDIQIWDLAIALTVTVDLTLHRQPGIKRTWHASEE